MDELAFTGVEMSRDLSQRERDNRVDKLVLALQEGASIKESLARAGIPLSRYQAWLKSNPYFRERVELARGLGEGRIAKAFRGVALGEDGARGDPTALRWLLSRLNAEEYASKSDSATDRPPWYAVVLAEAKRQGLSEEEAVRRFMSPSVVATINGETVVGELPDPSRMTRDDVVARLRVETFELDVDLGADDGATP